MWFLKKRTYTTLPSSIPQTLQAIDLLTNHNDLLEMFCACLVKNKGIGIYDGGYKCVELATGKKFERDNLVQYSIENSV